MIKIKRTSKPTILRKKAEEWKNTLLYSEDTEKRNKVLTKYRHKEIKDSLIKMFHGKCAYCESKINHIDYGHIEHYRPKSLFPELTFEWSNLFLACGICNGKTYKGNQFPETNKKGPFINPCDDNPDDHFTFDYDSSVCLASVYGKTPRGETTEQQLGLNRHDLRQYRSNYVCKLVVLARLAENDSEAQALLEDAKQDNAEYAAFIRYLTRQ